MPKIRRRVSCLPSARWSVSRSREGEVRVDIGVREGDTISPFYDPMIAKVIAHADTREAAIEKLADALESTQVAGLQTNNAFLIRCLRHPDFIAGHIHTGFIERHHDTLLPPAAALSCDVLEAAAWLVVSESPVSDAADPWNAKDGFRLCGRGSAMADLLVDGKRMSVEVRRDGKTHDALRLANGGIAVMARGETFTVDPYDPFAAAEAAGGASDCIVTPMPARSSSSWRSRATR